jgi:two-component system response regulator NreC
MKTLEALCGETAMSTGILLADHHRIVREGVRRILEQREDFTVVGEAADGESAVRQVEEKKPDIAIVELLMPRLSGVEAIRRIVKLGRTRCVVLSAHQSRRHVQDALHAGACGYVLKDVSSNQLLEAIDVVRFGRFFFSPDVTQYVVDAATGSAAGRLDSGLPSLTNREREVLQLIAEGLSTKEIAACLGVATRTADSHRGRLMEKLGIHKASGLVRFAIREGLVSV